MNTKRKRKLQPAAVYIERPTHDKLREFSDAKGLKLQHTANRVILSFLEEQEKLATK